MQISYLIKHGSDAYAMHDALLIACSWHSSQTGTLPSLWRRIARIWGSLYLVIFIKISSDILPRKFYFRIPLVSGGITQSWRRICPCLKAKSRSHDVRSRTLHGGDANTAQVQADWRRIRNLDGSSTSLNPSQPKRQPILQMFKDAEYNGHKLIRTVA